MFSYVGHVSVTLLIYFMKSFIALIDFQLKFQYPVNTFVEKSIGLFNMEQ